MKTDLNSRSSIFARSKEEEATQALAKGIPTGNNYSDIDELVERINLAIEGRDLESLPWLQLEVQARTMIYLRMIDWKMWEIHNRYVKT